MADKELKDIEQVAQRVADAHGFLHIDDKTAQLTALDAQIAQAGFWDDAQRAQQAAGSAPKPAPAKPQTYVKDKDDPFANVGRNDPCPCGSGLKFKKCHGKDR